jgi:hypothetical protein
MKGLGSPTAQLHAEGGALEAATRRRSHTRSVDLGAEGTMGAVRSQGHSRRASLDSDAGTGEALYESGPKGDRRRSSMEVVEPAVGLGAGHPRGSLPTYLDSEREALAEAEALRPLTRSSYPCVLDKPPGGAMPPLGAVAQRRSPPSLDDDISRQRATLPDGPLWAGSKGGQLGGVDAAGSPLGGGRAGDAGCKGGDEEEPRGLRPLSGRSQAPEEGGMGVSRSLPRFGLPGGSGLRVHMGRATAAHVSQTPRPLISHTAEDDDRLRGLPSRLYSASEKLLGMGPSGGQVQGSPQPISRSLPHSAFSPPNGAHAHHRDLDRSSTSVLLEGRVDPVSPRADLGGLGRGGAERPPQGGWRCAKAGCAAVNPDSTDHCGACATVRGSTGVKNEHSLVHARVGVEGVRESLRTPSRLGGTRGATRAPSPQRGRGDRRGYLRSPGR